MIDLEALVVGAVTRLMDVENRDHQTGPVWSRPTRLVAWMYSALVFRLPEDHHQSQPRNVEAHRDHIGSDRHMHSLCR